MTVQDVERTAAVSAPPGKRTLAERIAALSPEQRALLKLRRRQLDGPGPTRIPKRLGSGPWPASTDQTALWFIQQLEPETAAYNIGNGFRLKGTLDVALLGRCLREMERRHEILRTTFRAIDGQPYQVIASEPRLTIPITDVRHTIDPEAAAHRAVTQWIRRPFDLERGPLIRLPLVRIAADDYVLVGVLHHIVTDWWSYHLLFTELFAIYQAFSRGRPSPFPELPIQFADWSVWRDAWQESEAFRQQEAYWLRRLQGAPTVLEIYGDRPRPAVQSQRGARAFFRTSPQLTRRLRAMNRRAGTSSFMTLLALTNVLLWRYTGQVDFLVGTPVSADRDREDTAHLIGYLLNTLVLRADLAGEPSFLTLLERVRTTCLEAFAHKELPFRHLVDRLQIERDMSRMPLYQVEFLYISAESPLPHSREAASRELPDFEVSDFYFDRKTSPVDLQISFTEGGDEVTFLLEYNTDIFEPPTVQRMGAHLVTLLEGLLDQPERSISGIGLLAPAEGQALLEQGRGADGQPAVEQPLHCFFEQQAARTPETMALWADGEELTYAELARRAERVAAALTARGVGAEDLVALATTRGADMVAGLLGILKSGAAYLPLDPDYPAERQALMLRDGRVAAVLTEEGFRARLAGEGVPALCLEALPPLPEADARQQRPVHGAQTAYVIYTSGSTGRPKGVRIPHRGAVQLLAHLLESLDGSDLARVLASTSLSFDMSFVEIFVPLAAGGQVVLVDNLLDLARLPAAVAPTLLNTVPSVLAGLLRFHRLPTSVRTVILGGEALPPELARALYGGSVQRLINGYGPTEATVYALLAEVPAALEGRVAIGRPPGGVEALVLDHRLEVVPVGVPGELFLGGGGLARGYHRRPALTAERFLPHVASRRPGARLYRSGDLVRWRDDGEIDYLGRLDAQVKIRGYRIEIGEIEAALVALPEVREAVVVLRRGEGAPQLVAWVAGPPDTAATRSALVSRLQARLPSYMVPAVFAILPQIPLTPSGKADRTALTRRPLPAASLREGAWAAPVGPTESRLAEIWKDLLGLSRLGRHDNFFALGGDSILSIQMVARARQAGLEVTPKDLFQNQTLAGLAGALGRTRAVRAPQGEVSGPAPLTPIQHWFFAQPRRRPSHFNLAVLLTVEPALEAATLQRALARLVAHHDALRLRFHAEMDGYRAEHAPLDGDGRASTLVRIDLGALPTATTALAACCATVQGSLNLTDGPLLAAALIDTSEGQRLLLAVHHLVVDGVSWRILLEDLETLLAATATAAAVPALPPKTTSWQEWAGRLVAHASGGAAAAELDFWRSEVARARAVGVPAAAPLAADFPDGASTYASLDVVNTSLDAVTTRALLREVPAVYQTRIDDVLLTALVQAVAGDGGDAALRVDLEGHGRTDLFPDVDLSRTVGWFTALVPVTLELAAGDGRGEALKSIKEQLRRLPGAGLGFGLLRHLHPTAGQELAAMPAAALAYNYLGQLDGTFNGGRLRPATASPGPLSAAEDHCPHPLEVNAAVLDGCLHATWGYSRRRHRRATIERLAARFEASLRALIDHCLAPGVWGRTPSDFSLVPELDQTTLDRLVAEHGPFEDLYPTTPMQQGLLFHTAYAPRSQVYSEQIRLRFRGVPDAARLRHAWWRVAERHTVLRTLFVTAADRALQLVLARPALAWTEVDGQRLSPRRFERLRAAFLTADLARGFTPAAAPPMRLALLRAPQGCELVWTYHHALLDGWSLPVLLGEVGEIYHALGRGQRPALPVARPYRDFVAWLAARDTARSEAHWRHQLAGFKAPNRWPRPEGARAEVDGHGERQHCLSAAQATALRAFARRHGLTPNTLLQGAWGLLASRYTGARDVVFGVTVAGRPPELVEVERRVGLFINTVPLRLDTAARGPLLGWLRALQERQLAAWEHESTALPRIQALSGLPAGTPLFESLLVFENYPLGQALAEEEEGLAVSAIEARERVNYPLTLVVAARQEWVLRLLYDAARFDGSFAARLLAQLADSLRQLVAAPQAPLGSFSPLTPAQAHQLRGEWNDTARPYPADEGIDQIFARQVAQRPEAVAVVATDQQLSYGALARRAGALAQRLRRLGVGPESRVGVCLERSPELPIALLAVLQAGGAYVPLDATYPAARLAFLIADAGVSVLLTAADAGADGRWPAELPRLELNARSLAVNGELPTAADGVVAAEQLAYVLYTSGSTGRPKGVGVPHRGVLRLLFGGGYAELGAERCLLHGAPVAFDASTFELWGALLRGGRVVFLPPGAPSAAALGASLARERVDTLWLTAPLFNAVVDEEPALLAPVAQLLIGGEALSPSHVRRYRQRFPQRRLVNGYGPTESTTFACCHPIPRSLPPVDRPLPIGRPIGNTRVHVLDPGLQPLPPGAPGELCIAGAGLARGYLGHPGLTAERFLPDPLARRPGGRLYRSGDRARWSADGRLDFLGRLDQQVKVRGHRIELGEVEVALGHHPSVRTCAVLAREDGVAGVRQLVAYVVTAADANGLGPDDLRRHLQHTLPDYMVPAGFVFLERLPLTANGKVDRRALPAPDGERPAFEGSAVAPRNATEALLAKIWRQVLGLATVGVEDNFFALGGDSILSLMIVSRAQRAGLRLTPQQLFAQQTIAALAALPEVMAAPSAMPAAQEPHGPLPLTPIQHWFFGRQQAAPQHFNQGLMLTLAQPLEPSQLAAAITALIARHGALRLRFTAAAAGWEQRQVSGVEAGQTPWHVLDLSRLSAGARRAARLQMATAAQGSLSLSRGPLLRAVLFQHGPGHADQLLLVIHHLAVDGVSWRILLEELALACAALAAGRPLDLGPATASYGRWAEVLAARAAAGGRRGELPYWTALAEPVPPPLPVDLQDGPDTVEAAEAVTVVLDAVRTRALLTTAGQAYRTEINDLLLAALARTLTAWTGDEHCLLDLESHGRQAMAELDVSRTVGWFTAIAPLRLTVPPVASPGALIKAVKEQLRRMPDGGVGFGLLRYMSPDPAVRSRLAALPRPQVGFNYLGRFDAETDAGAPFTPADVDCGAERSPRSQRDHLLEVSGLVSDGRLRVAWGYSRRKHRRQTVAALAERFLHELEALIDHCLSPEAGGVTPSDFPLAGLDQGQLDQLLAPPRATAVETLFPLSPMQQGMLFHSLYAPASAVYCEQLAWMIRGPVDGAALERAWGAVVARHQVLRAVPRWEGLPRPLLQVARRLEIGFERHGWHGVMDAAAADGRLDRFLEADRRRGFDFSRPPLMRLAWITLVEAPPGVAGHVLVWTFHHLLLDGWAVSTVLSEVLGIYQALTAGSTAALPPAPAYGSYIAWLESRGQSGVEDFWRRTLRGFTAPTPLPHRGRREGGPAVPCERHLLLPAPVSAALGAAARRHRLTLSTVVHGAWGWLLSCASGEREVVFGSTVAGRPPELPGVERMVGLFINTLPLRLQASASAPLVPWLARLQDQQAEQRHYEATPLVAIQGWSELPAGQPLFESLVVFENYPLEGALDAGGPAFEVVGGRTFEQTNYPLTVVAIPGERLRLRLSWDGSQLAATTVARLGEQLHTLLAALADTFDRRLGELPLLTAAARHQLVIEANDTRRALRQVGTLPQLFSARVQRAPAALAAVAQGEALTYGELEASANRLAHYLRARGVGPEVRVGVCLERTPRLLVGLMAILKAGGAYVPLEPHHPPARLTTMAERAGVALLLTGAGTRQPWTQDGLTRVDVDAEAAAIARCLATAPASGAKADNLAYVIFTSGSSGEPKGVMVRHRAAVQLIDWVNETFLVTPADRLLFTTALSFDLSVYDIFGMLAAGGTIAVAGSADLAEPRRLAALLRQRRITFWDSAPAALAQLVPWLGDAAGRGGWLQRVFLSGDWIPLTLPDQVRAAFPDARVIALGGATEATVWSNAFAVGEVDAAWASIPYGRPMANARYYILNERLAPCASGAPGDLYVAGDCLATGYAGDAAQTAEKFIPDLFLAPGGARGRVGGRMYHTGDRARFGADGIIEFLGRRDQQVKVRGFRIELGEIEAVLASHPAVARCAVAAPALERGDRRLVAFVVAAATLPADDALAAHLASRLPDYMVPLRFVSLASLPLTVNGKLDRAALEQLAREALRTVPGASWRPPRTPVEQVVAAIWEAVLACRRVGLDDDFFALGGHSLLATQVVSRLRAELEVELPLADLFAAPTLEALARRIEGLRSSSTLTAPAPVPVARPIGGLPLSFAQERLWFLERWEPEAAAYLIVLAFRLHGALDVEVLRRACGEVVGRHEVLRSRYLDTSAGPRQVADPSARWLLPVVDLRTLSAETRQGVAARLMGAEARRPFDLGRSPQLRTRLLRHGTSEHVLLLTMHHIAADAWSLGVLLRELAALYRDLSAGRQPALPALPLQYADFAVWQRRWLEGEILARQLDYWRQQLVGVAPLALPTDRPRPPHQTVRGAVFPFAVSGSLTDDLRRLSRERGTTLFMTLLAVFATLLRRVSGAGDFCVGSPIAGRNRVEIEDLVGFFVNTLALRIRAGGDPRFSALLTAVREVALGAYAHQDLPFERLVEELEVERDLSRSPLFQVMFTLDNAPLPTIELMDLELAPLSVPVTVAKFDLTLSLAETEQGLAAGFEYNVDLLDRSTVQRLAKHFCGLLGAVVAAPEQRLAALPMLTSGERHQLRLEWNDMTMPPLRARPASMLDAAFVARARRCPEAVAIYSAGAHLSYQELDRRSDWLASRLRGAGIGAESRVGVLLERSPTIVVGLLAILKAGGAWVPLDPTYPASRLRFMLADSGVAVLLTRRDAMRQLGSDLSPSIPTIDPEDGILHRSGEVQPPKGPSRHPDHPAYVIYTSGSTGRPKGVVVPHRAIVHYLWWKRAALPLASDDRVVQLASLSFDVSVDEIFWPLLSGAGLVLVRPGGQRDSNYLVALIARERCTHLGVVPSLLPVLFEAGIERCRSLRRVLCAGEALPFAYLQRFHARHHGVELHNLYGPTEAAVIVTAWISDPFYPGPQVPIGRPLAGLRVHVLDAALQPLPIGVPGELLIGGEQLARGYLDRPRLTAARFLPDPHGSVAGARLYASGDLARRLPGGEIDVLGRLDDQVKVRGFRIELGEIEAVLLRHPAIQAAAVTARDDGAGGLRRLVAYVVSAGEPPLHGTLAAYLGERLPAPMVPEVFVAVTALPMTPAGKADRATLGRLAPAPPSPAPASTAPRTPVERLVAEIWCTVLGRQRVGIAESFFALGGHSLLATRVMARLRAACGAEVPLRDLFEAPTVAGLARRVEAALRAGTARPAPPLVRREPAAEGEQLPLSFAQQRLWFLDRLEPDNPFYNIPAALRLEGALHVAALRQSIEEVVRRHEVLRTDFLTVAGEGRQVIRPPRPFPMAEIDLRALPSALRQEAMKRLLQAEARRPFDLARGPLLRVTLLRLGAASHVLVWVMHHIVSDGWSMDVLTGEVAALYTALRGATPVSLPPLALQYADFALWQRRWLAGEVLAAELDYWRQQLAGMPNLELAADRPRGPLQTYDGRSLTFPLPAPLRGALEALGQAHHTTLFMLLLAAFEALLARYTGQQDFCVGTPIAGRTRRELEPLIGCFVNTLVLRADLAGTPSFSDLLARVREVALGAYAHQDMPFESLVEALPVARDASRPPLFQVMFALHNLPATALHLPELTLHPVAVDPGIAKVELALAFVEAEEGLTGSLEYNTDLFDHTTARRLVSHYLALLTAAVAAPERPLAVLTQLLPAERQALLVEENGARFAARGKGAVEGCVHHCFEAWATRLPEAVAVACGEPGGGEQRLTYGVLNARANGLAHHLIGLGVGPEERVGLLLERSPEAVIALLGILKAGAAYLPLDADLPLERLAFLVRDAGVNVVVTEPPLLKLSAALPAAVVSVEEGGSLHGVVPDRQGARKNPAVKVGPSHLAYVLYTSGSTGAPKGVMIRHGSASGLLHGLAGWAWGTRRGAGRRVGLNAPLAFDVSVSRLLALGAGHTLYFLPRPARRDSALLQRWLGQRALDALDFTPSHLETLVEAGLLAASKAMPRVLVVAGELLGDSLWRRLRNASEVAAYNAYGPTECTVYATASALCATASGSNIGRPLPGFSAVVMGADLRPLPRGVPGELCLGGGALARGYLARPGLTAERFVPHPFAAAGRRLYRSGDRVRWTAAGEITYLGRLDRQVKVRGFRVELGEVEAALGRLPEVGEVAVERDAAGGGRLVAYVVAAGEQRLRPERLRSALAQVLPPYMVPSLFVSLDRLPLTASGKVDRGALPAQGGVRPELAARYLPPRTLAEQEIVTLWEELLALRPVGVRDDFFALGGHSLLAVRLMASIEQRFGRALPLHELFLAPTVEGLARSLAGQAGDSGAAAPLVAVQPMGAQPPFFCVHAAGGTVLCYHSLARLLGSDQPFIGLQAPGVELGETPLTSVEAQAELYLQAIRARFPAGPYRLGGWSYGGLVAFEMARRLAAEGEESVLVLFDTVSPESQAELSGDAEDERLAVLAKMLERADGEPRGSSEPESAVQRLRALPAGQRVAYVAACMARVELLPPGSGEPHVQRLLEMQLIHLRSMRAYQPQPYGGALHLLRAEEPMREEGSIYVDKGERTLHHGWQRYTTTPVHIHAVPGNHMTILEGENVAAVAAVLRQLFARPESSARRGEA